MQHIIYVKNGAFGIESNEYCLFKYVRKENSVEIFTQKEKEYGNKLIRNPSSSYLTEIRQTISSSS